MAKTKQKSEKDFLLEEAKALKVKGASRMNLEQLKAAVAAAKAPAASQDPSEPKDPDAPLGSAEAELSKDASEIKATGKFEVVEVKPDQFRMFNEKGQAVSPVVSREDKTAEGKPALAKLHRDARRSNALRKQREIRTPRGHEIAQ